MLCLDPSVGSDIEIMIFYTTGYDGNVYTWGANDHGQCARLPLADLAVPKTVTCFLERRSIRVCVLSFLIILIDIANYFVEVFFEAIY